MADGLDALTEREKQVLRLLLAGHDAKSSARELDLSVHTVNDYLRSARRKSGVPSSREAARLLGTVETIPEKSAAEAFGIAVTKPAMPAGVPYQRGWRGNPLAWLGGGMLMMSLIIAAAIVAMQPASEAPVPAETSASQARALPAAREWAALLDGQKWAESYRKADAFFRSQISEADWTKAARSVREPLGRLVSRDFASVTSADTLPGAPKGEYEIIAFTTNFAARSGATETVVMRREADGWKVVGYFIR